MICRCGCPEDVHNHYFGCMYCGCRKYVPVYWDADVEVARGRWQNILEERVDVIEKERENGRRPLSD